MAQDTNTTLLEQTFRDVELGFQKALAAAKPRTVFAKTAQNIVFQGNTEAFLRKKHAPLYKTTVIPEGSQPVARNMSNGFVSVNPVQAGGKFSHTYLASKKGANLPEMQMETVTDDLVLQVETRARETLDSIADPAYNTIGPSLGAVSDLDNTVATHYLDLKAVNKANIALKVRNVKGFYETEDVTLEKKVGDITHYLPVQEIKSVQNAPYVMITHPNALEDFMAEPTVNSNFESATPSTLLDGIIGLYRNMHFGVSTACRVSQDGTSRLATTTTATATATDNVLSLTSVTGLVVGDYITATDSAGDEYMYEIGEINTNDVTISRLVRINGNWQDRENNEATTLFTDYGIGDAVRKADLVYTSYLLGGNTLMGGWHDLPFIKDVTQIAAFPDKALAWGAVFDYVPLQEFTSHRIKTTASVNII